MSDFNFTGSNYGNESLMSINNLCCLLHMPKALKSKFKEGVEVSQGLPPYSPRKAFKVDEYHCPENWMHGSGLANSYFVPVESEHGMWLDFNKNFYASDRDVAILISVQGLNPLDGQSMVDSAMHMRQYKTKCPVHDLEFGADRYCEKCGYKWVPQNYLCTTSTPGGLLWLDGFLASDGVVRQYYFTEEEAKGVAHQVIGAEKKVYSIGIAFYLSKNPKPVVNNFNNNYAGFEFYKSANSGGNIKYVFDPSYDVTTNTCHLSDSGSCTGAGGQHVNSSPVRRRKSLVSSSNSIESPELTSKLLEIGAGAKIDQKVYADLQEIDYWQDEPAGLLYINYTSVEQAIGILQQGKKDLTKKGEGYLAGLSTGR